MVGAVSGTDERYTPESVLAVVREFATIVLDPCTTEANPVGAGRFYTKADDGLSLAWYLTGLAFVNPPYSRGSLQKWADKCLMEARRIDRDILLLVPADPSTAWSRTLLENAEAMAYWHKRIAFIRPDGTYEAGAKQPSAMYYFGERVERFRRIFQQHGTVLNLRAAR